MTVAAPLTCYRPGGWIAVVGRGTWLLANAGASDSVVEQCWDLIHDGAEVHRLITMLGARRDVMYALVGSTAGVTQAVVRGPVRIELVTAAETAVIAGTLAGDDWTGRTIGEPVQSLTLAATDEPTDGGPILMIEAGVVLASILAVELAEEPRALPVSEDRRFAESPVAEFGAPVSPVLPPDPAKLDSPADPTTSTVPLTPPAPMSPTVPIVSDVPLPAMTSAADVVAGVEAFEPSGQFAQLFLHTTRAVALDEAGTHGPPAGIEPDTEPMAPAPSPALPELTGLSVLPQPPPAPLPPPATPGPPPHPQVDPSSARRRLGDGLISDVSWAADPGVNPRESTPARPTRHAPVPIRSTSAAREDLDVTIRRATATADAAPGGPTVAAVRCVDKHLNPLIASSCRVCAKSIPPQDSIVVSRPALGVLHMSTSDDIRLDRGVIFGRVPGTPDGNRSDQPYFVQLADKDISRQHLEVKLDGWDVIVVDLHSSNGSAVTMPGGVPEILPAGGRCHLLPGTVVHLSETISFVYEVTP